MFFIKINSYRLVVKGGIGFMFNGGMIPGFVVLVGVGAAGGGLLGAAPMPAGMPGKSGRTYKPRCVSSGLNLSVIPSVVSAPPKNRKPSW